MNTQIPVYDVSGKELEKIEIDFQVPQKEISPRTYSQGLRVLLQNWRQGTVACKTRSEVSFSRKKPWRQKGTGRARAGSARSPLWRKGGIIFGPQPRTRELDINRKQTKLVLNNIFYNLFKKDANKKLLCLDLDLQKDKPKTKIAFKVLRELGLQNKKVVLFLPFSDSVGFLAFRNVPNVSVFCFDQPNAYDLSNGDCWVFLKKDMDLFKKMVLLWS